MPILGGFGKKEHASPVDKVMAMKSQGASNDEIIQTLQRDGHKSDEIFDAISQADIKRTIAPTTPQPMQPLQNPMQFPSASSAPEVDTETIQEVAETIIDEKWNVLVEQFNKIVDWKDDMDKEIVTLNERMNTIQNSVQDVQKAMMGRLEKYDENVSEIGTDVKALTKVFQKMLPGFVENISELSRITENLKGSKPKKQKPEEEEEKSRTEEIFGEESIEDLA